VVHNLYLLENHGRILSVYGSIKNGFFYKRWPKNGFFRSVGRSRTDSFNREGQRAKYRFIVAGVDKEHILFVERRKDRILLCSSMGRLRTDSFRRMAKGTDSSGRIEQIL
jgi:hypothetical protein